MGGQTVNRVLDRLAGLRANGPGRWMARCPSHEDKSPSLSIRETHDGRVLINCFGGCGAGDVMVAIGLRLGDLFEKPLTQHLPPIRGGFSARELLELNAHEITVAAMLADKACRETLSELDAQRLRQAAARIGKVAAMVLHGT